MRGIDVELIDMFLDHRNEPDDAAIGTASRQRPAPLGKFSHIPALALVKRIGPVEEPVGDQAGAMMYKADRRDVVYCERPQGELRSVREAHPRCFLKNSVA